MAAHFSKYEDIILHLNQCLSSPPGQQTPCQLPANVGTADVKGVELESNMILGGGFSISPRAGSTSNTRTRRNPEFRSRMSRRSRRMKKAAVGLQWERKLGGSGTFNVRGDWSYQSKVFGDAFNNPFNRIPSYGLGHLRVGGCGRRWAITVKRKFD